MDCVRLSDVKEYCGFRRLCYKNKFFNVDCESHA